MAFANETHAVIVFNSEQSCQIKQCSVVGPLLIMRLPAALLILFVPDGSTMEKHSIFQRGINTMQAAH